MTDTERSRIVRHLTGKGWQKLADIREALKWPKSHYYASDLTTCVNRLRNEGVVRTTERGVEGFSVCLAEEVML